MKNTKGPWSVIRIPYDKNLTIRAMNENGDVEIATVYKESEYDLNLPLEANAHLISAAPELLESQKLTYEMLTALTPVFGNIDIRLSTQLTEMLRTMELIIDKAEGRLFK